MDEPASVGVRLITAEDRSVTCIHYQHWLMMFENTKKQGNWALGEAIRYFCSKGYVVAMPLNDAQSYDLVVEIVETLYRVQVKSSIRTLDDGKTYNVEMRSRGGKPGTKGTVASVANCDIVFAVCPLGCWMFRGSDIPVCKAGFALGSEKYDSFKL